jgi:5'-nucleotidase
LPSGKRHEITPNLRSCSNLRKVLDNILESVGASLKAPLCKLAAELDLRSHLIRTQEVRLSASIPDLSLDKISNLQSASADWFADILRNTYDDALCMKGIRGGVDGVFVCAGMLRGDSVYGPGTKSLFGFQVGRTEWGSDVPTDRIPHTWRRSGDPSV